MIESFGDYLIYDETSPSCLRWVKRSSAVRGPGEVAGGCLADPRYWQVALLGKHDLAHRAIWRHFNGPIPKGMQIDHIDGNGLNNRIENLRIVPCALNHRNRRMTRRNKTGVVGVRYREDDDSYEAIWRRLDGVERSQSFSCRKYGKEEAFRLAVNKRAGMIQELNRNGAGYTKRHGTGG